MRTVDRLSNELEFGLHGVEASKAIEAYGPALMHEVNPHHVVELNVSMTPDICALNAQLYADVDKLASTANSLGGTIYGGSTVFADVSGVEPRRYRTTSLSDTFARGLLDITSQQVVLGMPDERLGFELYDLFRRVNPVLVALTASSPYAVNNGNVIDTENASRRIGQYKNFCARFPENMWHDMPELHSLKEHQEWMRQVSGEVLRRLGSGEMDANWPELLKARTNGNGNSPYYPFNVLEPHQVYTFVRVRPDHRTVEKGGESLFSLELRVPDIPTTRERMQMLNSLVAGLAYDVADHGYDPKSHPVLDGSFAQLEAAARYGMKANIKGVPMRKMAESLMTLAARGLEERGYGSEVETLGLVENVLTKGNDADLIRKTGLHDPASLRTYLANRLIAGEKV